MKKILMVCLGNICRSPAAEGFFQSFIDNKNLAVKVDSAATSNHHVGEQPDKRMQQSMRNRGIDISHLRGREVTAEDFEKFDYLYAMDRSNFNNLKALAECEVPQYAHKVELFLMPLHAENNDEPLEVPDPYFGGEDGFERCVDLIERGARARIEQLGG